MEERERISESEAKLFENDLIGDIEDRGCRDVLQDLVEPVTGFETLDIEGAKKRFRYLTEKCWRGEIIREELEETTELCILILKGLPEWVALRDVSPLTGISQDYLRRQINKAESHGRIVEKKGSYRNYWRSEELLGLIMEMIINKNLAEEGELATLKQAASELGMGLANLRKIVEESGLTWHVGEYYHRETLRSVVDKFRRENPVLGDKKDRPKRKNYLRETDT
jgi:hypothetical protein